MKISITLLEADIRHALAKYINSTYGTDIDPDQLPIEVKSKQNYRSEWEAADIRIAVEIVPRDRSF